MNALTIHERHFGGVVTRRSASAWVPELVAAAGPRATDAYIEFFTATIRNRSTQLAYARACSFQRKQYFDFPQAIQQATANLRTPANQLCSLLSCGYFKASKRFFPARTFHPRDVEYVVGRIGLRLEQIELHLYAKET